jgi:hypothetical protein
MFCTFFHIPRWPITNSSLSIPTHTAVTSGLPSGLMEVRWANGLVATSSQTNCGIFIWTCLHAETCYIKEGHACHGWEEQAQVFPASTLF